MSVALGLGTGSCFVHCDFYLLKMSTHAWLRRVLWRPACARYIGTLVVLHRVAFIDFQWWDLKKKKTAQAQIRKDFYSHCGCSRKYGERLWGECYRFLYLLRESKARNSLDFLTSWSFWVWGCRMCHPDVVFDSDIGTLLGCTTQDFFFFFGQHEAEWGWWPLLIRKF